MNARRFAVASGLGLLFVLLLALGSRFGPARASADGALTPTPPIDRSSAPLRPNTPPESWTTDDPVQPQVGVSPLAANAPVIANGDFEGGQDGSWEEFSTHGWDIIMHASTLPDGVTPHSGNWVAWLGGGDSETSYISQTVAVPVDSTALTFWYWIGSADQLCGQDFAWVVVDEVPLQVANLCTANNTYDWVEGTADLGAYAGETVSLQFRVETDGTLDSGSSLLVDDVTIGEIGGNSTTYLPLVLNNYWPGYFDDFSDPSSGWLTGESEWAIWGYLGGEYRIYLKRAESWFWITPGTAQDLVLPSDYRVEADIRKVTAGGVSYGLRFGQGYTSDAMEFYEITIYPTTGDYAMGWLAFDGSWNQIIDWTPAAAINRDDYGTNHIAVERVGTAIVLYINGTQVANVTDANLLGPGRDAGFVVYAGEDAPSDVRFDNFSASQP